MKKYHPERYRTTHQIQLFLSGILWFTLLTFGLAKVEAQVTTADIVGTVTDSTGAILPNVKVTVQNLGTHEIRTTQTTSSGDFTFTLLNPGRYQVTVVSDGFKTFSVPSLNLSAGDRSRIDAKLEVGSASQTVEVTAVAPALQTDRSTLTNTVTEQAVQDLPLNGRNYINLAQLTPGSNEGPANGLTSGTRPDDRRQTSSISVNGQSDVINDEMVDGMDNNERIIGTIGIRPSVEAIQEINVQTNTYTAEVGRTAGGVINIITKSGTNAFHGSAYEFFRNDALDTYPFQFGAHNAKPRLRQNQFGASLGGPIFRNKTFFFGDYEGLRQVQGGNPVQSLVPTAAQYAQIRTSPTTLTGGAAVDSVGLAYAMLYPLPNAGESNGFGNYVSSPTVTRNSDTYDIRIDHHFNQNNLLYGRYTYNSVPSNFPGLLPIVNQAGLNVEPGGAIYNFYGKADDKAQNAQLNFIHTFSPSLLLELKFGYTRINNQSFPLNYGLAVNTAFGQPNVNLDTITSGLAPVSVTGYADLGDGAFIPIIDIDNTFQYMGAVTWNKGAHNIKIGAGLIRRQALNAQNNYGTGNWSFNSTSTVGSLGELIAGNFSSVQRNNSLVPPHYRVWEPSFYFQDDWHASSNLTLNLGVRYDVFTPFTEVKNAISNFDPATASIAVAGVGGVNDHAGLTTTYTNIAPRIGFAWTALPQTVVRGGFGISYFPMNYTSNSSLKNQPFVSTFGSCAPGNCPGGYTTFAQGLPLPTAASATNPSGNIPDAVDPGFRSSYLEQFNLTLERDFSGNVIAASYVGMLGRHIAQIYNDQNSPAPISNTALNALAAAQQTTPANAFNTLRPFYSALPNVTQIGGYNSRGASSYNALQVSLTRRAKHGLTLGANYTLAHGLDNVIGLSNEINDGFGIVPSLMSILDYGNSDVDIRNRGVITGNYELPFGKNLTGISGVFVKGWQANTILVWSGGSPFTITNSVNVANTNYKAGADRPNQLRPAKVSDPSISHFFDISAFAPQPSGELGSERKNPIYGPNYRHADLSLFKTFPIHESFELQFRAECFNIANMTNFATPNHSQQVANITDTSGNATDTYVTQTNNNGTITSTSANYNPRLFQFALKLQF